MQRKEENGATIVSSDGSAILMKSFSSNTCIEKNTNTNINFDYDSNNTDNNKGVNNTKTRERITAENILQTIGEVVLTHVANNNSLSCVNDRASFTEEVLEDLYAAVGSIFDVEESYFYSIIELISRYFLDFTDENINLVNLNLLDSLQVIINTVCRSKYLEFIKSNTRSQTKTKSQYNIPQVQIVGDLGVGDFLLKEAPEQLYVYVYRFNRFIRAKSIIISEELINILEEYENSLYSLLQDKESNQPQQQQDFAEKQLMKENTRHQIHDSEPQSPPPVHRSSTDSLDVKKALDIFDISSTSSMCVDNDGDAKYSDVDCVSLGDNDVVIFAAPNDSFACTMYNKQTPAPQLASIASYHTLTHNTVRSCKETKSTPIIIVEPFIQKNDSGSTKRHSYTSCITSDSSKGDVCVELMPSITKQLGYVQSNYKQQKQRILHAANPLSSHSNDLNSLF